MSGSLLFSFNPDNTLLLWFKTKISPQVCCLNAWSPAESTPFVRPLGDRASWKKVTKGRPLRIIACFWFLWHCVLPGLLWYEQPLPRAASATCCHHHDTSSFMLSSLWLTETFWNCELRYVSSPWSWFCQFFCHDDAKVKSLAYLYYRWCSLKPVSEEEVLRSKEVISVLSFRV